MNQYYRDGYYGSILDPLHGNIKLSEIEKWFLAQPIFSRLRYVKQNTFLYYVFPSANHTRFEHSIGVMHMAGKIFDSCKENYATGSQKSEKYSIKKTSFFDLNKLGDYEALYYQELRLAGLLHDVGHGPMSHLFDEFCISNSQFFKILGKDVVLEAYLDGFKKFVGDKHVEHEVISCVFIFHLVDRLKYACHSDKHKFSAQAQNLIEQISAERIVKMISPSFTGLKNELIDSAGNNYTSFFSKIITAFPIDADRMDYLIRDSYFSGVTYGIYDLNRIYSSFQARLEGGKVDLAYKESGIDSMLRFIQSRTHLYSQVYFHKTNRAVNTMLTYATRLIRKGVKIVDAATTLGELMDFYVRNSDEVFVKTTLLEKLEKDEKEVLKELIERKLFKRVYEKKIVLKETDKNKLDAKRKAIKEIERSMFEKLKPLNEDNICAVTDHYENPTFKDAGEKNVLLAKKTPSKAYSITNDWKNANREFELADMVVCIIRVYIRRTFHTSEEYKMMSSRVESVLKDEILQLDSISAVVSQ
jgi:uncharacterized protein